MMVVDRKCLKSPHTKYFPSQFKVMLVICVFVLHSVTHLFANFKDNDHNDCWWSGCQPRYWFYRGCYPKEKFQIRTTSTCTANISAQYFGGIGDKFYCCPKSTLNLSHLQNTLANEDQESGICSWYGGHDIPQGSVTASGKKFDRFEMTAAHKTLPFGTRIRVKHTKSGRTVDLIINDRGPFIHGRILDLSYGSFGKLEKHEKGLFHCSYVII